MLNSPLLLGNHLRSMSDGSSAVVLFNRGTSAATVSTSTAELGLGGTAPPTPKE